MIKTTIRTIILDAAIEALFDGIRRNFFPDPVIVNEILDLDDEYLEVLHRSREMAIAIYLSQYQDQIEKLIEDHETKQKLTQYQESFNNT